MRAGFPIAALVAAALAGAPSVARASGPDEVRVGGRTYRGTVQESRPGVLVRIRLDDGSTLTVPWSEVVSLQIGSGPAGLPPTPRRPADRDPCESRPKHWYGWQLLISDAGSVLLVPIGVGLVTYAVVPPVMHGLHSQWGSAASSLVLRLGLPPVMAVTGLFVGARAAPASQQDDGEWVVMGGLFGLLGGMATAMAIDDSLLAWAPDRTTPLLKTGFDPHLTLVPMIAVPGGPEHGYAKGLGIAGTF